MSRTEKYKTWKKTKGKQTYFVSRIPSPHGGSSEVWTNVRKGKAEHYLNCDRRKETLIKELVDSKTAFGVYVQKVFDVEYSSRARGTITRYQSALKNLDGTKLSKTQISKVTLTLINIFLKDCASKDIGQSTLNNLKYILKKVIGQAYADGFIERNFSEQIKAPEIQKKGTRRPARLLSPEELDIILDASKDDYFLRDLFVIAVNTGLRFGELQALDWSDIDFENRRVFVGKTVERDGHIKNTTKNKKSAYVPLNEESIQTLKQLRKKEKTSEIWMGREYDRSTDAVFRTMEGSRITVNQVRWKIDKIKKQTGIHFSMHDFRDTCGTRVAEVSDIKTASEVLRHTDTNVTLKYYIHSTDEKKAEAVNKLHIV